MSEPTTEETRRVTLWMRALAAVCLVTLVAGVVRDLFVADSRAVEVWLGFEVRGWPALATAPLHWALFGLATWAFWTGRPWVVPWAAAYLFYAAVSHLVWSEASPSGRGWPIGLAQAVGIAAAGGLLLRMHRRRRGA
jgi:hypothetical protein